MNTVDAIRRLAEARHLQRVDQTDTDGTQDALIQIPSTQPPPRQPKALAYHISRNSHDQ